MDNTSSLSQGSLNFNSRFETSTYGVENGTDAEADASEDTRVVKDGGMYICCYFTSNTFF